MSFPTMRHRRLRNSAAIRSLVKETTVTTDDFIYPLFITTGSNIKTEIPSMPDVYHFSLDQLDTEIARLFH